MSITSSIRDFASNLWPRSSSTEPVTGGSSAPATPATKPSIANAPSTFDSAPRAKGPVLSPSIADVQKVAQRAASMIQQATEAKLEGEWNDNPPESVRALTRDEQKQILDFANSYDSKLANWVKTSPFVRDSRPMTADEHETYFNRMSFQPDFKDFVEVMTNASVGRFNALQDVGTAMKGESLTSADQKKVGEFSNLYDAKLQEWAKTSPLLRGTAVGSRREAEAHFMEKVFTPMFRERFGEYLKAQRG